MDRPTPMPTAPKGLAFEIADLMLLQDWSKSHNFQVLVELDHYVEHEEYEEVVACYARNSPLRRWLMWRASSEIVVQPLIGRSRRFPTVTDALAGLVAAPNSGTSR